MQREGPISSVTSESIDVSLERGKSVTQGLPNATFSTEPLVPGQRSTGRGEWVEENASLFKRQRPEAFQLSLTLLASNN